MSKYNKQANHQTSQNDSSKIIDVSQLQENALRTQVLQLEDKCIALSQSINLLLKKIESKEEELGHLKRILSQSVPIIGQAVPINISDEEHIAEIQLQKLKENSRTRELTLDEIRKFDLLVKNKRLAQGNATEIEGKTKGLPKNISTSRLIELASKKEQS